VALLRTHILTPTLPLAAFSDSGHENPAWPLVLYPHVLFFICIQIHFCAWNVSMVVRRSVYYLLYKLSKMLSKKNTQHRYNSIQEHNSKLTYIYISSVVFLQCLSDQIEPYIYMRLWYPNYMYFASTGISSSDKNQ
jgi:cytochrome b subunit of formate dehydrogenase